MSGNTPLSALTGSGSLFNATLSAVSTHVINRVYLLFRLFLAGGAAYNLYRAYQFTQHPSYGLNDSLKLAKCHALYAEAKKKNCPDVQCEEMLVSITDKKLLKDKEELLVKIAQDYVEGRNPEHSYRLARHLTLSDNILNVVLSFKKDAPVLKNKLLTNALCDRKQKHDVSRLLQIAKGFYSTNAPVRDCMQNAKDLANSNKELPSRVSALCQIAQCHQEMGDVSSANLLIENARIQFINGQTSDAEALEVRLILADAFFSCGDYFNTNLELKRVLKLIEAQPTAKNVYLLAKLQNKIGNEAQVKSKFKNINVESLIETTLQNLAANLSDGNRAEDCLTLASIYQEGLVKETDTKQAVLEKALKYIDLLGDNTDEKINSKIDLLTRLSSFYPSKNDTVEIVTKIRPFYNRFDQPTPASRIRQAEIGSKILKIFNKAGMVYESDYFFQQHLANLKDTDANAGIKIGQLVVFAQHIDHDGYLITEQVQAQLQAAEALLPQLDPSISHEGTLALIAKGYSQIDPQKSLQLLENYQDKQAKSYKITAAVTAALTGITYFYPGPGLLLTGAYVVVTRRLGLL